MFIIFLNVLYMLNSNCCHIMLLIIRGMILDVEASLIPTPSLILLEVKLPYEPVCRLVGRMVGWSVIVFYKGGGSFTSHALTIGALC